MLKREQAIKSKQKIKYELSEQDRQNLIELLKIRKEFEQSLEKKDRQLL